MTVEVSPITDADIAEVADFLRVNYKDRIPWIVMAGPWKVDAPNHGFMLHDGQRIVGAHTAFYSERQVAERLERFCDLGTWYVLPEFRSHSIQLIKALLAQDGYHFTALTTGPKVAPIHTRLGFHPLDTSAALIPNLPWPTPPGRTTISADPDVIESTLAGTEAGTLPRPRTSAGSSSPGVAPRRGLLLRDVPGDQDQSRTGRRNPPRQQSPAIPSGHFAVDPSSAGPSSAAGDSG